MGGKPQDGGLELVYADIRLLGVFWKRFPRVRLVVADHVGKPEVSALTTTENQ